MSPELQAKVGTRTLLAIEIEGSPRCVLLLGAPTTACVKPDAEEPFECSGIRLTREQAIRFAMNLADVAAPLDSTDEET
jgi:hypothetical protein